MKIVRDNLKMNRKRKLSQWLSLVGMFILLGSLLIPGIGRAGTFSWLTVNNAIYFQLGFLFLGWLMSQQGIRLAHLYVRKPRPDEVLDQALKKSAPNSRIYHYVLPVPHLLLTPAGPIVLHAKYQRGYIAADGQAWSHSLVPAGGSVMNRLYGGIRLFFGQERLGNPYQEAEIAVQMLANYLRKHAPNVEEVPIGVIIVFTAEQIESLDVQKSDLPALHHSKLKRFMRQKVANSNALPKDQLTEIQQAFDRAANFQMEK